MKRRSDPIFPTTHFPVLIPTPTLIGMKRWPCFAGLLLALPVERVNTMEHFERGLAGIVFVQSIVQWRVPERHDRITHVFIDRALVIDDGVGQGSEKTVHQRRQSLRIVFVEFRNGREPAHVAEDDAHVALFAAEHELVRRLRQLLHKRRRQVLPEGGADSAALRLLADNSC